METLGERRVRVDFNVSGSTIVDDLKQLGAIFINSVDEIPTPKGVEGAKLGEFLRLKSLAMTAVEEAAMWAVKAATYKE